MKILIIGKGFIGERLSYFLSKADNFEIHNINRALLDYTDPVILHDFLKYHETVKQFDKIIIAIGYTGDPNVDACELQENKSLVYNYNVAVPSMIIDIASHYNITCIYVGSGCIFEKYENYTEKDTPNFGLFSKRSSFYSKMKHLAELQFGLKCHIFRIRLPYTFIDVNKNLFVKMLKYNTTLDVLNSITSVDDFYNFIYNFLLIDARDPMPFGPYNVVNPQAIKASDIVELMKEVGITEAFEKDWQFISDTSKFNFKANRSNTTLSTDLITSYGLRLPDTEKSIKNALINFKQCRLGIDESFKAVELEQEKPILKTDPTVIDI